MDPEQIANLMEPRLCAKCNKPISQARLEVLPDTWLCLECAMKSDQPMRKADFRVDPDAPHPRGW